jgi:hypothetical protein
VKVRAHVHGGRLTSPSSSSKAPAWRSLPDPDELTLVDRAELEAAVEESTAQFERGERQC